MQKGKKAKGDSPSRIIDDLNRIKKRDRKVKEISLTLGMTMCYARYARYHTFKQKKRIEHETKNLTFPSLFQTLTI